MNKIKQPNNATEKLGCAQQPQTNNNNKDKARWQRAAEGWYPKELSMAADPFKQNGDNETIRPKLVLSVPVYHTAHRRPSETPPSGLLMSRASTALSTD